MAPPVPMLADGVSPKPPIKPAHKSNQKYLLIGALERAKQQL